MKQQYRNFISSWIGSSWIRLAQRLLGSLYPSRLVYTPKGWDTPLYVHSSQGWSDENLIATRKDGWDRIVEICNSSGPLGFSYEDEEGKEVHSVEYHNIHMIFAYVLALVAHKKEKVSVLDWGGGLAHYYLLGKALLPDISLDYHCAEVPAMVELGKKLNVEVQWYSDERYLKSKFDLVMINASLQYVREWKEFIRRITETVDGYFFLTRIPVVDRGPGFVAVQRESGTQMLHQQFHASELIQAVERSGLTLVREFIIGDRPYIKNAPEQCEMRGWLFQPTQENRKAQR